MAAYFTRYDDNILTGATITCGATPSTGYALTTLALIYPDQRVRFGTNTLTVTFTLGSSATGAILLIPWHNLTPGSSSVLTLTNSAGLSQAIPVPALMDNGLPHPIAYDFSALANRTSTVWNLVISGNASNVQLGAGIGIYSTVRSLASVASGNILMDFTVRETHFVDEVANEYGAVYLNDYGTQQRALDFKVVGTYTQLTALVSWFRANHGRGRPSLFWPDTSTQTGVGAPLYGRWQKELSIKSMTNGFYTLQGTFDEMSRGRVAA